MVANSLPSDSHQSLKGFKRNLVQTFAFLSCPASDHHIESRRNPSNRVLYLLLSFHAYIVGDDCMHFKVAATRLSFASL